MPDTLDGLKAALQDRYAIQRELGRGGMATVYLAEDLKHERPVALKVLRPELAAVLGADRFLREIKTTAHLTHPHILPLLDSGDAAGTLYYVMPYVEGESLRDRLTREKQLPVDDALQISHEVADALSYAHSHGVIHRDIKPENILLESGHAVVADFGIARAVDQAGGEKLTATGVALGTPAYMSPEQAAGSRDLDGRSDLYSLGCVLYEMLAGQPPFVGPTLESVIHQHLTAEPPSISNIRPSVPSWVVSALQRALAKTPADRFNPVAQFGEAIAPRVSVAGAPVAAPRVVATVARRRWRRIAVAAVAVIAVAGGWLGWKALRAGRAEPELAGPRPYAIVADVDGTADAGVRQTVRAILAAALDQSEIVQALPDDQIQRGLRLAGRPDTTTLNLTVARELAVRGAIRVVVAGSVDRAGTTYHVSVRVVDADSGTVLAAERAVARGDDDVIPVVDRLMRAVREQLGERPKAIVPTRPFAEVATPSFAAYQRYRRGISRFRAGDQTGAIQEWEQAIALDSGFAQVWSSLGNAYTNLRDPAKARAALDRALAHADRLTDLQRSVVEVLRARLSYDYISAAELVRRHVNLYGPSEWGLGTLADCLAAVGRMEEAISVAEELERSPPPFGFQAMIYSNHARWLAALGRIDEAWEEARHLTGRATTSMGARIAVAAGDWAMADSLATILLRDSPEPAGRRFPLRVLASVSATRGQVSRAMDQLREVADGDSTQLRLTAQRAYGAMLILAVASGAALDSRELRGIRADTAPGGTLVALWLAASGDTARAWKRLAAVRALPAEQRTRFDTALVLCEAWLAAARGHTTTVVSLLRPVVNAVRVWDPPVNQLMRWTLAQAFERTGQPDSAVAWLERIANWGGQVWGGEYGGDDELRGFTYSFVHFRLGRLYAELGKADEAKQHYATFLDAFTQPDPEYEWMVTEVRAKLAELARGR